MSSTPVPNALADEAHISFLNDNKKVSAAKDANERVLCAENLLGQMQIEHTNVLEGLHGEIANLQRKCSGKYSKLKQTEVVLFT